MVLALSAETKRASVMAGSAIGIVAFAACDMIHEVLGHGTAIFFTPSVKAVMLTTVATSSLGTTRIIAAAGTIANLLAGAAALLFLGSDWGSRSGRYFAWLLGTVDLLNATAYPVYSGVLNYGDWQVVIAGLQPQVAWRIALVVIGLVAYVCAVYVSALALRRLVEAGVVPQRDVFRLVLSSYLAGGLLFVAGAALNPIGLRFVWLSGVASGFAAMGGLLWMPGYVNSNASASTASGTGWKLNWPWIIAALLVALVFVLVIGRGVRL